MIELFGNLSQRHRQLNEKVKETITTNINFDCIKDAAEQSDVDRIYKIDVASKYKNVDYIIQVLKSGDALYISRALKSDWLFENDFSNIINTDYLHHNIFPTMSFKMKKKFLTTISQHVTDENRAAEFFTYCKNVRLDNIANKFLLSTSESFKIEFLSGDMKELNAIVKGANNYIEHFLKKSFLLAEKILEKSYVGSRLFILCKIRFLYSISDIKYLDLFEKYGEQNSEYQGKRLGLRLSKEIVTKHKERVRSMPKLYIKIMNKKPLEKYSTAADAKIYLVALLPDNDFWRSNYCHKYRYIIDLIPPEDKFNFIKEIFKNKYPGEKFEDDCAFYNNQCYYLMTTEQKEAWALAHVESQLEILGEGNDFRWYKFVNFNKAFLEIKKLIMITPDKDKRPDMLKVLVESAKSQDDLVKLLNYFYDRHVNEQTHVKTNFIDEVIYQHNVFEFEDTCWGAFDKILCSLQVYSTTDFYICKTEHKIISLIYHIIKNKDIPEGLKLYVESNLSFYSLKAIAQKLTMEERNKVFEYKVFEYLFNVFLEKFNTIIKEDNEEVKFKVRHCIHMILDLLSWQNKNDCPDIILRYAKMDWDEYRYHDHFRQPSVKLLTEDDLISSLKKDSNLVVEKLPDVQERIQNSYKYNLNRFMKKIKLYFAQDNAKIYLDFFVNILGEAKQKSVISKAVYNIFLLADETFKEDFMKKYVPTESKIDHTSIDEKVLYIQRAICEYACVSRPPVPLKTTLAFVKGDYVLYCLPMFNSYLAHLPLPRCLEFVEAILDAPLSLQKHGLRLAFVCFIADDLLKLVTSVWKRTKNVSLRRIIFKALHEKILRETEDVQTKLFEALKTFILDLHHDDEDEVFNLAISRQLPRQFQVDAIETLWTAVLKLPEKKSTFKRTLEVLRLIEQDMNLISEDVLKTIVAENIKSSFAEKETKEKFHNEKVELEGVKWRLTASYITNIGNKDELDYKLELTKSIIQQYLDKWDSENENEFIKRRPLLNFVYDLDSSSYNHDFSCYKYVNIIFETILETFEGLLQIELIYMIIWKLKLCIATRNVIIDGKLRIQNMSSLEDKYMAFKDVAGHFTKNLGVIFNEFKEKNLLFPTFLKNISDLIQAHIEKIRSNLMKYCQFELKTENLKVLVCKSGLNLGLRELNLVIIQLMPLTPQSASAWPFGSYGGSAPWPPIQELKYEDRFVEDYKSVLCELGKLDDREVRCNLFCKFINSKNTRLSDLQKNMMQFF